MVSAYEIMLALRSRNYMSNDLRRAGADISRLGGGKILAAQSASAAKVKQLTTQQALNAAELASLQGGTKRVALDKQMSAQRIAAAEKVSQAEKQIAMLQKQQLTNAATLSTAQRRIKPYSSEELANAGPGSRAYEAQKLYAAAQAQTVITNEALVNSQAKLVEANDAATATSIKAGSALGDLANEERLAAASAIQTADALAIEEERLAKLTIAANRTKAAINFAGTVEHIGRAFQTFGFLTTAAFGLAAKSAAAFNTQATLASTQATIPGNRATANVIANSRIIQNQLQQMLIRGQTTASPTDLTSSAYSIYSSITLHGNQKQQINEGLNLLKEFNKVLTANYGQTDLNEVTKAGIALINDFGVKISQLPQKLNTMQAAVRYGAMTMGQFISSLKQIAPAYSAAGYSFEQLASDVAAVSRFFPQSLATGTTGLARLTETFAKYNKQFSAFAHVNIAPGGNLLPISQVIADLIRADPQLLHSRVEFQNLFKTITGAQSTVQARRVFSEIGSHLQAFDATGKQVLADNKELTRSFTDMAQTPEVRWKEFTSQLHGLVLEIGTGALPVFQKLAKPIENLIKQFDSLSPHTRKIFGEIGTWVGAISLGAGSLLILSGMITRVGIVLGDLLLGKTGLLAAAKSEEGFASRAVGMRLGLLALIPIILIAANHFHQMHNAIKLLSAIIAILTFRSLINNLSGVGRVAATSAGEVDGLRLAMSRLNGVVAVATIVIVYRKQIRDAINWTAKELAQLGLPAGPPGKHDPATLFAKYVPGGAWLQNHTQGILNILSLGLGSQDAKKAQQRAIQQFNEFRKTHSTLANNLTRQVDDWLKQNPNTNPQKMVDFIKRTVPWLDSNTIKVLVASAIVEWHSNLKKATDQIKKDSKVTGGEGQHGALSKQRYPNLHAPPPPPGFNMQAAIANVERLRAIAQAHPSFQSELNYENALKALQAHFSGTQLTALNDYLTAIESADKKSNRKRLTEAQKAARERLKVEKDAQKEVLKDAQTLQSQYQTLYNQNQSNFGQLFNGPFMQSPRMQDAMQYGYKPTGKDLLSDIRSQVANFRHWRTALTELRKRGITGALYEQIVAAGPAALPDVRALLELSKADLRSYSRSFNRGQGMVDQATQQDMNLSLIRYHSYGRNIALQIIEGLRSANTPLIKVFEDMILKDFPGLSKRAGGKGAGTHHGPAHDKAHPAHGVKPHNPHSRGRSGKPFLGNDFVSGPTYIINTKEADVSTALRKTKRFNDVFYGGSK